MYAFLCIMVVKGCDKNMFYKKKKLAQEAQSTPITEVPANQNIYKDLDDKSFEDADDVISAMANQQRKQINTKTSTKTKKQKVSNVGVENDEHGSAVKFGYIEETDPSEELIPITNLDQDDSFGIQERNEDPFQPIKNPYKPEDLEPIELNYNNYNSSVQPQGSLTDFDPLLTTEESIGNRAEPVKELDITSKKKRKKQKEKEFVLDEEQIKKKNKKIINIIFSLAVLLGIGLLLVYTYFSSEIELLLGNNETIHTKTIDQGDLSTDGENIDYSLGDLTYDTKLSIRDNLLATSLSESLEYLAEFNKATTEHLKDITNEVVLHKSENTRSIENEMQEIQDAIKKDIETVNTYKKVYIKFSRVEVITKIVERLENAYDYAGAIKNNMTEKAMVECANSFIEKEQELNQVFIDELVNYLNVNDVNYEVRDSSVKYSIKSTAE